MSDIKRSVSMYSLQDSYLNKRMDLEDIFKYLKSLGEDEGIELLSDQMIKGAPHPEPETLEYWHSLVRRYDMPLVCNDIFINTSLYKNRTLTKKESLKLLCDEIRLAADLGFSLIRPVSNTPTNIIEPALPYCEKYGVSLALEIHAGMSFGTPFTDSFTEIMQRTKSPYLGLVIDAGIFCRRLPRVFCNYFRMLGANPELIDKTNDIVNENTDMLAYMKAQGCTGKFDIPSDIKPLIHSDLDMEYFVLSSGYECCPFEILDGFMPYVRHIHGKVYEMTDDGEYSIPYDGLIRYLHSHDYRGYISTEYEGNRFTPPTEAMKEKENITMHQMYMKKCIDALQ